MKKFLFVFAILFSLTLVGCAAPEDNVTRFNTGDSSSEAPVEAPKEEIASEEAPTVNETVKEEPVKNEEVAIAEINDAEPVLVEELEEKKEPLPEETIPVPESENKPEIELKETVKPEENREALNQVEAKPVDNLEEEKEIQPIQEVKTAESIALERAENNKTKHDLPNVGPSLWMNILIASIVNISYLAWRRVKHI